MPAGMAGGAPLSPLATLQTGMSPETFQAMEMIFDQFDQCFAAIENAIMMTQGIQNSIQQGLAGANFHIAVPSMPPPPPASAPAPAPAAPTIHPARLSAPRMTLQPFYGKPNENIQAWLILAEEALTASDVPKDHWTYVVVQSLRGAASTWYIAKQQENNDKTPDWDEMKKSMLEQWDNPARINELHMRLDELTCTDSIAEFTRVYQEIEQQIPIGNMSPGDHIYKFLIKLLHDLYMLLINKGEKEPSFYYSAARIWEGLQNIPQRLAAACQGPPKFPKKFRPMTPQSMGRSITTMPYLSASAPPSVSDPMDLDAMNVARDPR
jgi:hypothetical protein